MILATDVRTLLSLGRVEPEAREGLNNGNAWKPTQGMETALFDSIHLPALPDCSFLVFNSPGGRVKFISSAKLAVPFPYRSCAAASQFAVDPPPRAAVQFHSVIIAADLWTLPPTGLNPFRAPGLPDRINRCSASTRLGTPLSKQSSTLMLAVL